MSKIQKARLLGWVIDTLESTSYKTTREFIQTFANRPGGQVFNEIASMISQYENAFLSDQQKYESASLSAIDRATKYAEHITQQPQFKQSLCNALIYIFEKNNFDEFYNYDENRESIADLLSYSF